MRYFLSKNSMDYIETWKEVILRPADFYSRMSTTGGYADPPTFVAISLIIYGLLNALIGLLMLKFGYGDTIIGGMYSVGQLSLLMIIFVLSNVEEFIIKAYDYDFDNSKKVKIKV